MLIDELRSATKELHRRTESAFDLQSTCSSPERYADLLGVFLALHRPLEQRLGALQWDAIGFDWNARRKVPLLERDLLSLGRDPAAMTDLPVNAIAMDSMASALGVQYVIEGSTLGGQFISKHVAKTLGFGPTSGCAYFAGYGERTGPMWKAFVDVLNHFGERHPQEHHVACDAAAKTFETFEAAFRG